MNDMQLDILLAFACLYIAAVVVLVWRIRSNKRKSEAAQLAVRGLQKNLDALNAQMKTLTQLNVWNPGDPRTRFMAEHLHRKVRRHNEVAQAIRERLKL